MDKESLDGKASLAELSDRQKRAFSIMVAYDQEFEYVFSRPYWQLRLVLEKPVGSDMLRTFESLLDFFIEHRLAVTYAADPWRDYIRFALQFFHTRGVIPYPLQIKQKYLVRQFASQPIRKEAGAGKLPYGPSILTPVIRDENTWKLLGMPKP